LNVANFGSAQRHKTTGPGPFGLPLDTPPMEAISAEAIPVVDGPWQYQPKWDGFRCLCFKAQARVEMRAKSGKPLGRYFPEVMTSLAGFHAPRFVLDGGARHRDRGALFV
jgi:ATP-dependent DNA ligase